jgi:hypothetical protein
MFSRKIKLVRFLVLVVYVLVIALSATSVLAASATTNSITLNFPSSYVSCKPADMITTTGVPANAKVSYQFIMVVNGVTTKLGSGFVYGNLNMPFPYPQQFSGQAQFGVSIVVTKGKTMLAKLRGKWTVKCEKPTETPPPPPPGGGEGCTPGYWRQEHHFDSWVGFNPSDDFEDVFGVNAAFDPDSLGVAVQLGGGGEYALARHAVAALLNAASPDVDYLYSQAQVISMVQSAYASGDFEDVKDLFEDQNEAGCPLN